MKDWATGVIAVIAVALLAALLGAVAWSSYNSAVEELCQSLGWKDGGSGFTGSTYCTEESPNGNQTHRCVWTDAAAGECAPQWPVAHE